MPPHRRILTRLLLVVGLFLLYRVFFAGPVDDDDDDAATGFYGRAFRQAPPSKDGPIQFVPSSYDWTAFEQRYLRPAADIVSLPPASARKPSPRVQYAFEKHPPPKDLEVQQARLNAVRTAFKKAWDSYAAQAWGLDELRPLSGGGKNTFGGFGATLVDALDTLWIMGLRQEFVDATRHACALDFSPLLASKRMLSINVFETTIRFLGGLISAHDLSGEPALLRKAVELGDLLLTAFDTPNRIPGVWLNFADAEQGVQLAGVKDASASPATLSLEFTRLAQLTGNHTYYDAIDHVSKMLEQTQNRTLLPGMWPVMMNFRDWESLDTQPSSEFGLGAEADSLYEYLPKMHALLSGSDPKYEAMYRAAADVVEKHVLFRPMVPPRTTAAENKPTGTPDILFSGTASVLPDGVVVNSNDSQHLACFTGGMFALAGRLFDIPRHVDLGERLARGCAYGYASFPTGLLPEVFGASACPSVQAPCEWDQLLWQERLLPPWDKEKATTLGTTSTVDPSKTLPQGFTHARDPRYMLRPEAIESVFVLYRITGQAELRDIAWRMFIDIQVATSTPLGNAAIKDVTASSETEHEDSMESFWLAETLKYFYLIFSNPSTISLDEWVLNTEAHPFKRI